jgi:hypothetical protein
MMKKTQPASGEPRNTRSHTRNGHVCPNPSCKNKVFLSYAGFHRHIIQRDECNEYMERSRVQTPVTPVSDFVEFCLPTTAILPPE